MGVALPRPFGWSGMLDQISKIFWTKAYSMQKESWKNIHLCSFNNFLTEKCAWPCHALLGGQACSTKFSKIFWTRAYPMQKQSWKKIHPFSCNNFLKKKWAWSCHAPRNADRTSTMHLQTLLNLIYIELLQKGFWKNIQPYEQFDALYIVRLSW